MQRVSRFAPTNPFLWGYPSTASIICHQNIDSSYYGCARMLYQVIATMLKK